MTGVREGWERREAPREDALRERVHHPENELLKTWENHIVVNLNRGDKQAECQRRTSGGWRGEKYPHEEERLDYRLEWIFITATRPLHAQQHMHTLTSQWRALRECVCEAVSGGPEHFKPTAWKHIIKKPLKTDEEAKIHFRTTRVCRSIRCRWTLLVPESSCT